MRALRNALKQQRLHHAYLFTGTRGIGKTTVSRILAKSLNCTGPDGTGGITADALRRVQRLRARSTATATSTTSSSTRPSNRGIDEIRDLLEQRRLQAGHRPLQGLHDRRGAPAHEGRLQRDAEDAGRAARVPEVRARHDRPARRCCRRCCAAACSSTCGRWRRRWCRSTSQHVLQAEDVAHEPASLRLLARAARGSMRDALSLTDQAIAYGAGALDEAGVRAMLGAVDRGHAVRMVEALAAARRARRWWRRRRAARARPVGRRHAGRAGRAAAADGGGAGRARRARRDRPRHAAAARLAGAAAADETQLLYSIVLHGRAELGLAPDEYSGLMMVLLRMLAFRPAPRGGAAPSAPAAPAAAASAAPRSAGASRRGAPRAAVPAGDRRPGSTSRRPATTRLRRRRSAALRAARAALAAPAAPPRALPSAPPRWANAGPRWSPLIAAAASPRWCVSWRCRRSASSASTAHRRSGACASSASRCARRRCATSCRPRWPRRWVGRCS